MTLGKILPGAALAIALSMGAALAESPQESGVTAKRVRPPQPGEKRITVQITAAEHAAMPFARSNGMRPEDAGADSAAAGGIAAAGEQPVPELPGNHAWFWEKISPDIADARPGRLGEAVLALGAGGVATPRLQTLQDIARDRGADILRSTIGTQVSPALVLAVISIESAGQPDAESGAGAQGLMQLMPDTAARFGVEDSLAPEQNIAGGVKYLDWLMGEFENDPILVLAGYNAGEGAVRSYKGVPPYAETRDYVPKVLAAFQIARGLCATPPELITDGCVFTAMN